MVPPIISWFINPMKTTVISVISTINHSLNQFHGPVVTSWQIAPQSHWFQLDAWRCVDWNPSDVRCVEGKWFKKPYMIYPLIDWLWNISHFLWVWLYQFTPIFIGKMMRADFFWGVPYFGETMTKKFPLQVGFSIFLFFCFPSWFMSGYKLG